VSLELLLFLVLFVGLPLIQMLIRASKKDVLTPKPGTRTAGTRRPGARAPQPTARTGAPQPASPPVAAQRQTQRVRVGRPPAKAPAIPPVPAAARQPQRAAHMERRALKPALEEVLAVAARRVAPARQAPRPPRRATGLGNVGELRRSMVLMTILGSPRATNPHDWPPRAEG